jgi:hypothetical protein
VVITRKHTRIGDAYGKEGSEPHRQACGESGSDAADDAGNTNRIGASRLQQISQILQVPVAFFFEGAPSLNPLPDGMKEAPSPAYVSDFLATSEGLALTKAFTRIKEPKLRRRIVDLVEEIAEEGK